MRIQLFTLRFSNTLGGFDTTSLETFCRGRDLVGFREHFFVVHEVPHVLCVVTWQDEVVEVDDDHAAQRDCVGAVTGSRGPRQSGKRSWKADSTAGGGAKPPDPGEELSESDRLLFNELRDWRRARAQTEGVPPYILFTNRQLREVATGRPESAHGLLQLHGVGPGKVGKYGQEVLELVRACRGGKGPAESSEVVAAKLPPSTSTDEPVVQEAAAPAAGSEP